MAGMMHRNCRSDCCLSGSRAADRREADREVELELTGRLRGTQRPRRRDGERCRRSSDGAHMWVLEVYDFGSWLTEFFGYYRCAYCRANKQEKRR